MIETESMEIVIKGRLYRVIGSPSIIKDSLASVEVYVAETRNRKAHFRFLKPSLKRDAIVNIAQSKKQTERYIRHGWFSKSKLKKENEYV